MRQFSWVQDFVHEGLTLPTRQTARSAGYDLAAGETVSIEAGEIRLVRTGICVQLPDREFLTIYARSSLALRRRVILANGVGVVDADYYGNPANGGEIMIALWNLGKSEVVIERGERVTQRVCASYQTRSDDRAAGMDRQGGFGSTGVSSSNG